MPLKIPGLGVIYGHRPEILKKVKSNAKDTFEDKLHACNVPRKQDKPMIQLRGPSPYNQYPSEKSVIKAIGDLPELTTHDQVRTQVTAHLNAYLPAQSTGPTLILVGEEHGSTSALTMLLSTLSHVRGRTSKQFLLEQDAAAMEHEVIPVLDDKVGEFSAALRSGAVYDPRSDYDDNTTNIILSSLYARHSGFTLGGFDAERTAARDLEARETGMLGSLARQMANADVTVVNIGRDHVPWLHEQFSAIPNVTTVSMVQAFPPGHGDTSAVKSTSYALSTPAILKIKPARAVEDAAIHAISWINKFGQ